MASTEAVEGTLDVVARELRLGEAVLEPLVGAARQLVAFAERRSRGLGPPCDDLGRAESQEALAIELMEAAHLRQHLHAFGAAAGAEVELAEGVGRPEVLRV